MGGTAREMCTMAINAQRLRAMYEMSKTAASRTPPVAHVDPRGVFCNNALNLQKIDVYGFDYDYTLAVYTRALNQLIYDLSMDRLIEHFKYPRGLLSIPYDPTFAIRGLHYDVAHSCLLKVDAFSQIQNGTVYRGRKKLTRDEILKIYGSFSLSDAKGRNMMQLIDLFSLPWAGLLSTVVQYFDDNSITFDPLCMHQDVATSVRHVHIAGEMHRSVTSNLEHYVHKNIGLHEYLSRLIANGKQLFMVTNSPFSFMSRGMCYMLGDDWRKYFKYIVVMAKKPDFFQGRAPFRRYHEEDDSLSFEKVTTLEKGKIYAGGSIAELSKQALIRGRRVLYFGDHIYTDLADPILTLGWHTAAIVPELAREIRFQNDDEYRNTLNWIDYLTVLIEQYQRFSTVDTEVKRLIQEWFAERTELRERVKVMFNPQFGSLFRTYHSMTFFSRRLNRLAEVYTSRLPNMLKYSDEHTFFPRRNALPHEVISTIAPQISEAQLHI